MLFARHFRSSGFVGFDPYQLTVNFVELVAVPPGVVTEIVPVFAPLGTVADICVAELTVNDAFLPPNRTLDAPAKFVPVTVTCVPAGPFGGLKPLIVGTPTSVKLFPLTATPPGAVTEIGPVLAFAGTVAMIFMPLNLKMALAPLNATCVAPFKLLPLMVTAVPAPPLAGVKPLIVGEGLETTLKFDALVAVPPPVVTATGPLVAPVGTEVVIWLSELNVKLALVPLKVTALTPVNPVPLIVTVTPTPPLVGLKPMIVGAGIKVKFVLLVAVPPPVVTAICPVIAFDGTIAVICVSRLTVKLATAPPNVT